MFGLAGPHHLGLHVRLFLLVMASSCFTAVAWIDKRTAAVETMKLQDVLKVPAGPTSA